MTLEIEDLKAKIAQAPCTKMLQRLKSKATEAMKRFDDMTQQHAIFKMQLKDLSGTLQGLSSQSEGESSPDSSSRISAAGLSSNSFDSSSSSPRSQPADFSPNVQRARGAAYSGTRSPAVSAGHEEAEEHTKPLASGPISISQSQPASSSHVHSAAAQSNTDDTDAATLLPSDSELPCEPKLARWEIPKKQRKMTEELERQQRKQADGKAAVSSNKNYGMTETGNKPTNEPTAVPSDIPDKRVGSESQTSGQDEEKPGPKPAAESTGNRNKPKKKTKKGKLSAKTDSGSSQPVAQGCSQSRNSLLGSSEGSIDTATTKPQAEEDGGPEISVPLPQVCTASSDSARPDRMTPDSESSSTRASLPDVSPHQANLQASFSGNITYSPDHLEAGAPGNNRALPPLPAPLNFPWGHHGSNHGSFPSQPLSPPESVRSGFSSSIESHLHQGDFAGSDHSGSETSTAGSNYWPSHGGCQQCEPNTPAQPIQTWQWFHPIPPWMQPSRYLSRSVPVDVRMQIRPPPPDISEAGSIRGALSENDADDFEPVSDEAD